MSDFQFLITGSHTGANNAATLTDSGGNFVNRRVQTGDTIYNVTDGSRGSITARTATTITATLAGGVENDWDTNDVYRVWVTDPSYLRMTVVDELLFPMFAEVTIGNRNNVSEPSFTDFQKVRVVEDATNRVIFSGKITKINPVYDAVYGQTLLLECKDNLNELIKQLVDRDYLNRNAATSDNTRSSLVEDIISNHSFSGNIGTSDTTKFEGSDVTESDGVLDSEFTGKGKNALRAIAEIASDDPWDSTPTGFGFDYYLDTEHNSSANPTPDLHYFQRGERPPGAPGTYGLTVQYTGSTGNLTRPMLADYNFPKTSEELITRAKIEFVDSSGSAQYLEGILIEISNIAGGAFAVGNTITWNGGASPVSGTCTIEYVGSTFLVISKGRGNSWDEQIDDADSITTGVVSADVDRVLREDIEQDIVVTERAYDITDITNVRAKLAEMLYHGGNTIERGDFTIFRWPYYTITDTHDGANNAAILTDTGASFINNGIYPGDIVSNVTDGSSAIITARTATTITGTLTGGTDNDWDTGDTYRIYLIVRAGHAIRVVNSLKSIDQTMIVTRIEYNEGPKMAFARISVKDLDRGKRETLHVFERMLGDDEIGLGNNIIRSGASNTRVELSRAGLYGYNGGTAQFFLQASDGKGYFGAGAVVADVNGLTIDEAGGATKYIIIENGADILGWLYASSAANVLFLESDFTGSETGIGIGAGTAPLMTGAVRVHISAGTEKDVKLSTSSNDGNDGYILLISKKTTTGDPTGVEGKIYWNEFDNALKIYADGAWRTITTW